MTDGGGGGFLDADICGARYPGCGYTAVTTSLVCRREGRHMWLCGSCAAIWRERVQHNVIQLANRCPLCEEHNLGSADAAATPRALAAPVPLTGAAASSFDRAMHMEGLLPDIRQRVLSRLARDDAWLRDVKKPTPSPAPVYSE